MCYDVELAAIYAFAQPEGVAPFGYEAVTYDGVEAAIATDPSMAMLVWRAERQRVRAGRPKGPRRAVDAFRVEWGRFVICGVGRFPAVLYSYSTYVRYTLLIFASIHAPARPVERLIV